MSCPHRALIAARVAAILLSWLVPARAGGEASAGTAQRVRAARVLHCGAVPRPGLFEVGPDGRARGLLVEVCRAAATAVQPASIRVEFRPYDSAVAFEALRQGRDEVAFLTGSEILAEGLAGVVVPGPTVYFATTSVMVADAAPIRTLRDLAGQPVCSLDGSGAQRHLEAWTAAARVGFVRMGFREDGEMIDAYDVQACRAIAAESTALAALRRDGGVNRLTSRILPEPLATFPILIVTGTKDARWAAAVAWVFHTLVRAEVAKAPWTAGGLDTLVIEAPQLDLGSGWQKAIVATLGNYGDIFRRTLGDASPYRLPRGHNTQADHGGLLLAPYAD